MSPSLATVSPGVLAVGALGALGAYVISVCVYQISFGPLKGIPGPWYAKVSDTWLAANALAFHQCRAIDAIFGKYGPIVRLGPNKIGFIDANAVKLVYTKFPKDKIYHSLRLSGKEHAMTTLDPAEHTLRRRGFAPHYGFDNLARFQSEMHEFTIQVLHELIEISGSRPVDTLVMFRHIMVDVISLTTFDLKAGSVNKWVQQKPDLLTVAINDWPKRSLMEGLLPRWLWALMSVVPVARLQQFLASDDYLHKFVGERVILEAKHMKDSRLEDQERNSLVGRLLQYKMPNGQGLTQNDIVAELIAHTCSCSNISSNMTALMHCTSMAGTDTTSTALGYACWAPSQHPAAMRKLQAELDDAMDDAQRIPDIEVLQSLPYLNVVIKDVLRLYGPGPAPLPRTVPASNGPIEIHGHRIPVGTTILTQAWTVHKQESVYHDPEAFIPERWFQETEDMRDNFMPFGTGARICGGQK